MYDKGAITGTAASMGMLPMTGFNLVWFLVAAFTLIMAGGALLRLVPRKEA
jgi:LPXTG-motif cell wall-anchored protein